MANKKAQLSVEKSFTQAEIENFGYRKSIIDECQLKAEGLAEKIAAQLYIINEKKLYMIDDYSSMGQWAEDKFGISKGTCSDAINTFKRFGDVDKKDAIADKWSQYMFSTLIAMKGLTDKQIETAGITPLMSRSDVKKAITALKALEDKEKERPKLMKALDTATKSLHALCKDREIVKQAIESAVPDFFAKEKVNTVDEIQSALDSVNASIEEFLKASEPESPEPESPEQESPEPESPEPESPEQETPEQETPEPETHEPESPKGYATVEDNSEEDSIPTKTLDVEQFRRENGSIDKQAYLKAVWEFSQEVFNHSCEMVITWYE